jgi:hypothetical protein
MLGGRILTQPEPNRDIKAATIRITEVMQAHKGELLKKPNVVGVAVGFRQVEGESTDTLALVVMVDHKVPQDFLTPEQQIPSTLEGVLVDVQEIGEITAY